jgi:hypothetical protein
MFREADPRNRRSEGGDVSKGLISYPVKTLMGLVGGAPNTS